jgi:ribosomal RNA-processing protein 9
MRKAKNGGSKPQKTKKQSSLPEDESFFGGDESEDKEQGSDEEEDDNETPEQKRLRLSKEYLASLQKEQDDEDEGDEDDEDAIATRLQEDVLKARGKVIENVAIKLRDRDWANSTVKVYRGHRFSPTCLAVTMDDTTAFTGSKDCSIIRWDVETGSKQFVSIGARGREKAVQGHSQQVLGLSVSSDGNMLASGGRDKLIRLWDVRSNTMVHTFKGHRDAVTCLSFQRGSHTLYSGSNDRQVRIWDCDSRGARETLFGHQAEIHAIDALLREACVTVAADQSMRLWKIPEDSQLLFPTTSLGMLDTLSMFNDEIVLVGGEGGLALWPTQRRQPSALIPGPHGECGVITVKTLAYSNVACSGSWDGFLRLWELQGEKDKNPRLAALGAIPVQGFLNGLHMSPSGRFALAAVGQEHRLGRWNVVKAARNGLQVISLGAMKAMVTANEIVTEKIAEENGEGNDSDVEEEQKVNSKTPQITHAANKQEAVKQTPTQANTKVQISQQTPHQFTHTTDDSDEGDEGDQNDASFAGIKPAFIKLQTPNPKAPIVQEIHSPDNSVDEGNDEGGGMELDEIPPTKIALPNSPAVLRPKTTPSKTPFLNSESPQAAPKSSKIKSPLQNAKVAAKVKAESTDEEEEKEVASRTPRIQRLVLDAESEDEGDSDEIEEMDIPKVAKKPVPSGRKAPTSTSKRKSNDTAISSQVSSKKVAPPKETKSSPKVSPKVLRSRVQTPARPTQPASIAQSAQKGGKTPVGKTMARSAPMTEAPIRNLRSKK